MKASGKALTLLALAALLFGMAVQYSFRSFEEITHSVASKKHAYEVLKASHRLLASMTEGEREVHAYALTGNEAFLRSILSAQNGMGMAFDDLRKRLTTGAELEQAEALAPLIKARMLGLSTLVTLRQSGDLDALPATLGSAQAEPVLSANQGELSSLMGLEEGVLAQDDAIFQQQLQHLFGVIVLGTGMMLLIGMAFGYWIYREAQIRHAHLAHLDTERLLLLQADAYVRLQQAHFSLQLSEEKMAVTLASIGDGVIATDDKGRVTLMNRRAEELTGWMQVEAAGQPIEDIFKVIEQGSRRAVAMPTLEALTQGTAQDLGHPILLVSRTGNECSITETCVPMRDDSARVVGAVLVFRDVTPDHFLRQALADSTTLVHTILNTVVDGIITIRACDGLVQTTNPAAERLFGYTAEELAGQNISLLIPEFDQNLNSGFLEYYSSVENALTPGLGYEVGGRRKNGSLMTLEISLSEMSLGGKHYFTGIFRDVSARKQAEEVLLKGGALQNAIFNSANFSSIATDAKGVIQIFNVGAERMLGYDAEDVMNRITPADISDPQELLARAKALSLELATPISPGFEALVFKAYRGIEDIYELTYIRKDGSRFPAIVSVTALRDAEKEVIGYLLIGTDNTARKQAEAALVKAGALQSAIFNSENFSSIATDAKGVIQIFNVGAERMLGFTADEVVNKITPADISDPLEVIARAKALSRELDTPISPGFEALVFKASRGIEDIYQLTYIRKDGSRFPAMVSVTALRDQEGVVIGFLLIGTDNTARKLVEAEQERLGQRLRDSQFYARSLFEFNVDALMTTDPSGFITDTNQQMEILTDCTRDELIGARFKSFFTDPERAEESIQLVLSEKKILDYELTVRARNGKETVVSFNATTFYDRERNLQGVFAAARDITESKRLDLVLQGKNDELESAKSTAEKANLAKSEFLSSMSHELRSPLNAILGFAQLMESDALPPTLSQQESLTQILQAGWHLLKLIDQILDLAKVESGQVPMSQEPVSLAEVVFECQNLVEHQAHLQGISMYYSLADEHWFVLGDHTRVKQVLLNLLTNAIKYNTRDGTVFMDCAEITPGRIRVSIKDSGIGLAPDQLAQLFQAFNRLGQEGADKEGTGIGLVVAKRLVELMGGEIGVESAIGTGSVFWFELNKTAEPVLPFNGMDLVEPPKLALARSKTQQTILYVEDNPANLKLVERILTRLPHIRLLATGTGSRGVQLARETLPDLILMDINLPDMNGFDALKILRSDPATARIQVVALSANAMPRDIERALKAGFFRYITKPIKIKEFVGALDDALALPAWEAPREPLVDALP